MPATAEARTREQRSPTTPLLYRVAATERETSESVTLTLEPTADAIGPVAPGQFTMLWTWGIGEVPISASAITGTSGLVHTLRDVGAVSRSICSKQPGDVVGVRGPFGRGWDIDAARGCDVVLVAGGIGLAPLRPVVHAILAERNAFGAVSLVVGARSAADLLFRAELDGWWHGGSISVRTVVDRATRNWHGSVGVVTHELPRVSFDPPRTVAMLCGPEVMMRMVALDLLDRGVPAGHVALSLERNMQCGARLCGHCQLGPHFVCTDGPVVGWDLAEPLLKVREL